MTLTDTASDLFLYLVTFRRQVRKGFHPEMNDVRRQLIEIFGEQERMVQDDANLARLYERAKYVLVVLADEILINCNWSYSDAWEDEILEWEFFKTRIAGEEFFTKLEEEGEKDEALAEIYYLALSIGFVGQYSDSPTKILDMKRRLYRMLPGRFSDQDKRITPDAYHIAEGTKDVYKPLINLGRIAVVCSLLFISVLIAYPIVKNAVTGDIRDLVVEMKGHVQPDPGSVIDASDDEDDEDEADEDKKNGDGDDDEDEDEGEDEDEDKEKDEEDEEDDEDKED